MAGMQPRVKHPSRKEAERALPRLIDEVRIFLYKNPAYQQLAKIPIPERPISGGPSVWMIPRASSPWQPA